MSEEILAEWTATDAEGDGGCPYVPPLAQYGEERETVPGLLAGVQLVGSLKTPYIANGVAYLPLTTGADDDPPAPCNCSPAFYDGEQCCIGLVSSVEYEQGLPGPRIDNGNIKLPLCSTFGECPGIVGGIASVFINSSASTPFIRDGIINLPAPALQGLYTLNGPHTWNELNNAGQVQLAEADALNHNVYASITNGYLQIFVDRA